jgi:hypothetical protein
MKKGLLTVLLASLVLVGCQNYDDQFDDLNAQISALKSQVDGLSSLSGQVSSLSGINFWSFSWCKLLLNPLLLLLAHLLMLLLLLLTCNRPYRSYLLVLQLYKLK